MHSVGRLSDLRDDRALRVDFGDEKILLVRHGGAVRAYSAECPHAGAPLDEGAVCNGRIVCPWHKAAFGVEDGALIEPPALDGLDRYDVRTEGDEIFVVPQKHAFAYPPAQTTDDRLALVVGSGPAGTAAAVALREFGFAGRVVLVGREPGPAFDRTALSKFVVAGQTNPADVELLRSQAFMVEQAIERIDGAVARLDAAQSKAMLDDGRVIDFFAAIIATGGVAKTLQIPGADFAGVHVLRTRQDAEAILMDTRKGGRAVILGGGFIGLEVASALRQQDMQVVVVSSEPVPMQSLFGERIARSLVRLHEADGVRFHLDASADSLHGGGRVDAVILKDASCLPADLVVIGVGVRPATEIVENAPVDDDGAVRVDAGMRLAPGVYAVGDIAAFPLHGAGPSVRVEHWRVAQQQARVAARNVAGEPAIYDGVPFFWTYQCGKRFEYLGHAETWDREIIEGDLEQQQFVALLVRRGIVAAVVACGRERTTAFLVELMRQPLTVDDALQAIRASAN